MSINFSLKLSINGIGAGVYKVPFCGAYDILITYLESLVDHEDFISEITFLKWVKYMGISITNDRIKQIFELLSEFNKTVLDKRDGRHKMRKLIIDIELVNSKYN